jgi:hypothetical protein
MRSKRRQHGRQLTPRPYGDAGEHHNNTGIDRSAVIGQGNDQLSTVDNLLSRGRRRLRQRAAPAERSTGRHHASLRRQRLGRRENGLDQLDDLSRDGTGHVLGEALQAQLRDRPDRNLSGRGDAVGGEGLGPGSVV